MIALNLRNIVSIVGDFMNSVKIGLGLVKDWSEVSLIMGLYSLPNGCTCNFCEAINVGSALLGS